MRKSRKPQNICLLVSFSPSWRFKEMSLLNWALKASQLPLFLTAWSIDQQHQHHLRDRQLEMQSQTLLQTPWIRIYILIRFPDDSCAHSKLRSMVEYPRKVSKLKPGSALFLQENNEGIGEEPCKSRRQQINDMLEIGPWLSSCSHFLIPFPVLCVSLKKLASPGCPLGFIISHMRDLSFFPTWYSPNLHLQIKFLSWATDPYFQQCTEHLCWEAILLFPVPSYQNMQNCTPFSTHSLHVLHLNYP